jgi:hypothetical protein
MTDGHSLWPLIAEIGGFFIGWSTILIPLLVVLCL